ncbi:unnamed protein product, partial [Heterosigma akashiwo]
RGTRTSSHSRLLSCHSAWQGLQKPAWAWKTLWPPLRTLWRCCCGPWRRCFPTTRASCSTKCTSLGPATWRITAP